MRKRNGSKYNGTKARFDKKPRPTGREKNKRKHAEKKRETVAKALALCSWPNTRRVPGRHDSQVAFVRPSLARRLQWFISRFVFIFLRYCCAACTCVSTAITAARRSRLGARPGRRDSVVLGGDVVALGVQAGDRVNRSISLPDGRVRRVMNEQRIRPPFRSACWLRTQVVVTAGRHLGFVFLSASWVFISVWLREGYDRTTRPCT